MFLALKARQKPLTDMLINQSHYIVCRNCCAILSTYKTQKNNQLHKQKDKNHRFTFQQSESEQVYASFSKQGELLLVPPSQIHNTKIINHHGKWKISCEGCQVEIGAIRKSDIAFIKDRVRIQHLSYQIQANQKGKLEINEAKNKAQEPKKQRKLEKLTEMQQKLEKYLALAFQTLDQRLKNLSISNLQRSEQELRNFIKFYYKWKKNHWKTSLTKKNSTSLLLTK